MDGGLALALALALGNSPGKLRERKRPNTGLEPRYIFSSQGGRIHSITSTKLRQTPPALRRNQIRSCCQGSVGEESLLRRILSSKIPTGCHGLTMERTVYSAFKLDLRFVHFGMVLNGVDWSGPVSGNREPVLAFESTKTTRDQTQRSPSFLFACPRVSCLWILLLVFLPESFDGGDTVVHNSPRSGERVCSFHKIL